MNKPADNPKTGAGGWGDMTGDTRDCSKVDCSDAKTKAKEQQAKDQLQRNVLAHRRVAEAEAEAEAKALEARRRSEALAAQGRENQAKTKHDKESAAQRQQSQSRLDALNQKQAAQQREFDNRMAARRADVEKHNAAVMRNLNANLEANRNTQVAVQNGINAIGSVIMDAYARSAARDERQEHEEAIRREEEEEQEEMDRERAELAAERRAFEDGLRREREKLERQERLNNLADSLRTEETLPPVELGGFKTGGSAPLALKTGADADSSPSLPFKNGVVSDATPSLPFKTSLKANAFVREGSEAPSGAGGLDDWKGTAAPPTTSDETPPSCKQKGIEGENSCIAKCVADPLGPPPGTTCKAWCAGRKNQYSQCCKDAPRTVASPGTAEGCYF